MAEALSSLLGPDPVERIGELANHWVAAEPESDEAIDYAVMAGQHAMHNLAPQDGVHWFREALRLLDARPERDPHRRCTLLVDLGVAQRDTGDGAYRDVLLDAAALARELDAPALPGARRVVEHPGMGELGGVGRPAARRGVGGRARSRRP